MKRYRLLIAFVAFLLPLLIRFFWFYDGIYISKRPVKTPDYAEIHLPMPPQGGGQPQAEEITADGKIVLLDWAHNNLFDIAEIEVLIEAITEREAEFEIVPSSYEMDGTSLGERLKYADAYIVISPEEYFSEYAIERVASFVDRGGRVLVISDPTHRYDPYYSGNSRSFVTTVNTFLAPFDIAFSDDFLYNLLQNEGNYRNVIFHQFAQDSLTEDLSAVTFYGVRSLTTNTGESLILGDTNTLSSHTDKGGDLAVAVRSSNEGVVALGDITFLTPPYHQVADNSQFISNLLDFLLGGERRFDLLDFPYIFEQPVTLLETEIFDLSAETIGLVSDIQTTFESYGFSVNMADDPVPGTDLIVLNPYSVDEEVESLLEVFEGLILPDDSEEGTLTVPDFGELNPAGVGLILFHRSEERTLLILLADSADNLLNLAERLSEGNLNRCTVAGEAALCQVGSGEGFFFDDESLFDEFDFDFDDEFPGSLTTDEPLFPTSTPIPSP